MGLTHTWGDLTAVPFAIFTITLAVLVPLSVIVTLPVAVIVWLAARTRLTALVVGLLFIFTLFLLTVQAA